MSTTRSMNFQVYLKDVLKIIKQEPLVFIGGGLFFQMLFFITQGWISIIAGPLLGGYILLIILFLRENKRPTFNDLFIGFKEFGNLFPYFLVLLIISIGFALIVFPGLLLATWWLYVLPLMVDRKISFSEAMKISTKKVNETGFFMHLGFLLLVTLLPVLILILLTAALQGFMVLSVLLLPIQFGCLASLYVEQFKEPAMEAASMQKEATKETVPITLPPVEETVDQVKEEFIQPEQPVSEETETSNQSVTESFPEENVPDEKPDQMDDTHLNQTEEKPDMDSAEENKDTV